MSDCGRHQQSDKPCAAPTWPEQCPKLSLARDRSDRPFAIFCLHDCGIDRPAHPGRSYRPHAVTTVALRRALTVGEALVGHAHPIVSFCVQAFFISRAMLKTGLAAESLSYSFERWDAANVIWATRWSAPILCRSVIPSNAGRGGSAIFPIARSLAIAFDSEPGPNATRLGAFLMPMIYQGDVIVARRFSRARFPMP